MTTGNNVKATIAIRGSFTSKLPINEYLDRDGRRVDEVNPNAAWSASRWTRRVVRARPFRRKIVRFISIFVSAGFIALRLIGACPLPQIKMSFFGIQS